MEKAMYPSRYMRITQKDHVGTHLDSWAIDEAGSDYGIDYLIMPFTGVVKKIYPYDANEVWIESVNPVQFADGTKDYMTILLCHDNDVSDLWVGKVINQGQRFYEEGTKGNASGNHVHFECARGKFDGTGWHQNAAGYWSINNGKNVRDCLFVDDSYHFLYDAGYNFVNVKYFKDDDYQTGNYITKFNMRVRSGAGLEYNQVKVKDLTADGKAHATSQDPNANAVYKEGTVFTAKQIITNGDSVWARSPSGYICIKDSETVYCEKC